MVRNGKEAHQRPLMRLYALTEDISKAGNEADLTATEQRLYFVSKSDMSPTHFAVIVDVDEDGKPIAVIG